MVIILGIGKAFKRHVMDVSAYTLLDGSDGSFYFSDMRVPCSEFKMHTGDVIFDAFEIHICMNSNYFETTCVV